MNFITKVQQQSWYRFQTAKLLLFKKKFIFIFQQKKSFIYFQLFWSRIVASESFDEKDVEEKLVLIWDLEKQVLRIRRNKLNLFCKRKWFFGGKNKTFSKLNLGKESSQFRQNTKVPTHARNLLMLGWNSSGKAGKGGGESKERVIDK